MKTKLEIRPIVDGQKLSNKNCQILLDDKPINGVYRVAFEMTGTPKEQVPTVHISLIPDEIILKDIDVKKEELKVVEKILKDIDKKKEELKVLEKKNGLDENKDTRPEVVEA